MPRHPGRERWLVVAFVPIWVVCFALGLRATVRNTGFPSVFVAAPEPGGDHPIVSGFREYLAGADAGLRVGDRLRRVGTTDLTGFGPLAFFVAFVAQTGHGRLVPVEFERDGVTQTVAVPAGSVRLFAPLLGASVVFALAVVILAMRARPSPVVDAFVRWFVVMGLFLAAGFFGNPPATLGAIGIHGLTMTLVGPVVLQALLQFPESAAPRRLPRWPWLFAVLGPLHLGHLGGPIPPAVSVPAAALVVVAIHVVGLAVVTHNYRRADAIGRRQLKWFLFGAYCAAVPPAAAAALSAVAGTFTPAYFVSLAAVAFIPLALLVSMIRYNFFDIDRVIGATASYNVLIVGAVAVGVTLVPRIAEAASTLLAIEPWLGQGLLSLSLGLVVMLTHRRLRVVIDRMLFPDRYSLDQGVQQLVQELADCEDTMALTRHLGERLTALLQPDACVIYARGARSFAPLFVAGRAVPPGFELDGPLMASLRDRVRPLAFGEYGRRERITLGPFERAVLETLDAEMVVPIRRGDAMLQLLCLSSKRSGDVYTPVDLQLLTLVAEVVSGQLERFEQAEVLRQSRTMQQALQRYVPQPVAEALAAGRPLQPGEQEITIGFVDLRDYTGFCLPRSPSEIFSTVNRYTDAVSRVIQAHGGTIVEFNGDGMMAVFGAPQSLENKEEAAVRAARAVVEAVVALGPAGEGEGPLAVGVGIATGAAFVGNVQSADRLIWTALGNPVNLAARLQALTREFDALVAIDRATLRGAGALGVDFEPHAHVRIRGRTEPEDVYVLPSKPAAPA